MRCLLEHQLNTQILLDIHDTHSRCPCLNVCIVFFEDFDGCVVSGRVCFLHFSSVCLDLDSLLLAHLELACRGFPQVSTWSSLTLMSHIFVGILGSHWTAVDIEGSKEGGLGIY